MQRVVIIGNGGAGKSTLAVALGRAHRLPIYHLDRYIWRPNWEAAPESVFYEDHKTILDRDRWLIEGMGYDSTIEDRFKRSDTIIFIDFPIAIHFFWALKRSVKSIFRKPQGWADGCSPIAKVGFMIRIIWDIHQKTRPYILSLLNSYGNQRTIHHLRSPKDLREFYGRNCNV